MKKKILFLKLYTFQKKKKLSIKIDKINYILIYIIYYRD
jgi:hypothetical protein